MLNTGELAHRWYPVECGHCGDVIRGNNGRLDAAEIMCDTCGVSLHRECVSPHKARHESNRVSRQPDKLTPRATTTTTGHPKDGQTPDTTRPLPEPAQGALSRSGEVAVMGEVPGGVEKPFTKAQEEELREARVL